MCWGKSSVMFPEILRHFGSHIIIHPPSGDPAGVDLAPTSDLLIQIHPEALSAASMVEFMALLFAAPVMWYRSCKRRRRQILYIPPPQSCNKLSSRDSSVSSWYLKCLRSLASPIRSSQNTVSSTKRTYLEEADISTTFGLSEVSDM